MTLTQAAFITKRGIVIFIAVIFLAVIARTIFGIAYDIYQRTRPPEVEKPTVQFGILPKLNLPVSPPPTIQPAYSMDTTTGGLPTMPNLAKVYFVPQANTTLLSAERAASLATKLGFPVGPEIVSDTVYRFTDNNGGTVTIDISSNNFHFQRPRSSADSSVQILPGANEIVAGFQGYLSSKGLLYPDLQDSKTNVIYDGPSQSESETVTVSIWPKAIEEFPVMTPDYTHGLIKAVITKSNDEKGKFIKVDYIYWGVDLSGFSTYPLKSIESAYEDLENNQALVVRPPSGSQVSITSVYLAYYESEAYNQYLQPIYVFEGPEFAAYVSALDPEYTQ